MIKKILLKKFFSEIYRIREIQLEIARRYTEWKMRCPVHLSIGQESVPVGICQNLKRNDQVVTAHRSHAHYLAKGGDLKKMISELHGKVTGCARGKGGSMHLIDHKANVIAAVPIVGSTLPIGVGIAWGNKLNNNRNIVVIFFGDGATEEGVFQESLDFASLKSLRILFVCENNNFSVYSDKKNRQFKHRNICKMASALGINSLSLSNHDLMQVYTESKKIIKKIRSTSKPYLIEIDTYRLVEHCGPNNDDHLNYRNKKEIAKWTSRCQVKLYEKRLLRNSILTKKNLEILKNSIKFEISNSFNFANKSPYPKKSELNKDLYMKSI